VRRLAVALALVSALALTWLASSGRHAAAADPDLVVLYLSGWQSELNKPAEFMDHDWRTVDDAVRNALPGRVLAVPYSYAYKPASHETPPPYDKKDTNQSLDASAEALGNQLEDLGNRYPHARFLLVGHSEGGVVATYWAGKENPGAARVAGVVTFDSPVEGVRWADVYRSLLLSNVVTGDAKGAVGLAVLRGLFDWQLGDNGPLIDQLDRGKTPQTFTTIRRSVANMKAAGGKVYNGYDCGDLFILCDDAHLPGAEAHDFKLKFLADCRAEAIQRSAAHLASAAQLSPDWSDSPTAGSSAKLDPTKTKKCYTTMHHRVIEVPEAGDWVAGIAKGLVGATSTLPTGSPTRQPTDLERIQPVLDAIKAKDPERIIGLIKYTDVECKTQFAGLDYRPECPSGTPDGTMVSGFYIGNCEGRYNLQDETRARLKDYSGANVLGVLHVPATYSPSWLPPARYVAFSDTTGFYLDETGRLVHLGGWCGSTASAVAADAIGQGATWVVPPSGSFAPPTRTPGGLYLGATAITVHSPVGDCLTVRAYHTRQASDARSKKLGELCNGDKVKIASEKVENEGFVWWVIDNGKGLVGWAAEKPLAGGDVFLQLSN